MESIRLTVAHKHAAVIDPCMELRYGLGRKF